MRRTRAQDNTTTLATPVDTNTGGYYTNGPPATVFSVDDANIIQEELVALATVKGASLDTAGTTTNQCAKAVESPANLITGSSTAVSSDISTVWKNGIMASTNCRVGTDSNTPSAVIAASNSKTVDTGSAIIGGSYNTGSARNSVIVGGQNHEIKTNTGYTYKNSAIIGGERHILSSSFSVMAGGEGNILDLEGSPSAGWNFMAGGQRLTMSAGTRGAIIGGDGNILYGTNRSCIAAGAGNVIAIIGTGTASDCFIGGGYYNNLSESIGAAIIGTYNGFISASRESAIVGGSGSHIFGATAVIVGGSKNSISSSLNAAIIAGFSGSLLSAQQSVILGGNNNRITACTGAAILGGLQLTASSGQSAAIAGAYNAVTAGSSVIIGGTNCLIDTMGRAAIAGGLYNTASQLQGFIGGGSYNKICDNEQGNGGSAIVGANGVFITGTGTNNFFGGGSRNSLSESSYASAIGGFRNYLSGASHSVIVGGSDNIISGSYAVILGGQNNRITGSVPGASQDEHSVIAGGDWNLIGVTRAFIGGGVFNTATLIASVVLGGQYNFTSGSDEGGSLIAGSNFCTSSGKYESILASYKAVSTQSYGAMIGTQYCSASNIAQTNVVTLASRYVTIGLGGATGSYQVVGGYNANHSGVAPTWRIASNGGIFHATITTLQGVDYAELFENFDKKKHPIGRILTRKGTAAKLAHAPNERILGVVSACPNIIGGADNLTWQGEWLKDEWGAFVMETVEQVDTHIDGTVTSTPVLTRKRNPLYDPSKTHIPRTERPDEWTVVGLLGQIRVAIDETVEEDDYIVSGLNGIGTKSILPGKGRSIECMKIEIPFSQEIGYGVALCLVG